MITLQELAPASNGPAASQSLKPMMLTIGDSLMWGQGLLPEHRFRELVRQRLSAEFGTQVVEISMARSGAKLLPSIGQDTSTINSFSSPPILAKYSPVDFAREVPDSPLSSSSQLDVIENVLENNLAGSSGDIKFILLDGGINDIGIGGILAPYNAYSDGYFFSGWNSWILDKCKQLQPNMEATIQKAIDLFPNAVIIVNGYFPVFSYYSAANVTKLQSVGVLYGITSSVLLTPFGLDALATASATWQAASNKHIKKAIRNVKSRTGRVVLFARSNIEENRSLFAPGSNLWGYDAIPNGVPNSLNAWVQLLAGATPEDEVIDERTEQCQLLTSGNAQITCNLASLGHPNVAGALDYSNSITEALEDKGLIPSRLGDCALSSRRREKACTSLSDDWSYQCVVADAKMGKGCADLVKKIGEAALDRFKAAGENMKNAATDLKNAGECFKDAASAAGKFAKDSLGKAADNLSSAGDHLKSAADCWDQTAIDTQKCEDEHAARVATCNATYQSSLNSTCNIQCTSFTNCNRFGRFNPARYACRAARGVCVAAAAVSRGACNATILAIRETCKAASWTIKVACLAAVVLGNVVCSTVETGKALVDTIIAGGRVLVAVAVAGVTLTGGTLCAIGNAAKAGFDIGIAGVNVGIGIGIGGVAVGTQLGCTATRWLVNRGCRFTNWLTNKACNLGALGLEGLCFLTTPITSIFKTTARLPSIG